MEMERPRKKQKETDTQRKRGEREQEKERESGDKDEDEEDRWRKETKEMIKSDKTIQKQQDFVVQNHKKGSWMCHLTRNMLQPPFLVTKRCLLRGQ